MKLLTLSQVCDRTMLSKTSIYTYIAEGQFPSPVKIGANSRWIEKEIIDWIVGLADQRDGCDK
jgi:prophage regulatory protein